MNTRTKVILAAIGTLWVFAFFKGNFLHDEPKANDTGLLTEVKAFRNIRLNIVRKEKLAGGSYRLAAECDYKGKRAGFEILVRPRRNETAGYEGQVTYRSIGPESDRFLEMLNDYYLTGLPPKTMARQVNFNVKTIEGDLGNLEQTPVKMELICPVTDLRHYALFYTEIDLGRGQLYIAEQNTDYRKPLLLAFRGE